MEQPKHTIEELRNRSDLNRDQRRELASALAHYDLAQFEIQSLQTKVEDLERRIMNAKNALSK